MTASQAVAAESQSPSSPSRAWLLRNRFRLFVLAAIIVGAGWYNVAFLYARRVQRYEELEACLGQRVTFRGVFNRDDKAYELIMLDGHPITFFHTLGGIDWSPGTGELCRVVGVIDREPVKWWGIPYRLSQAEYFPVNHEGDTGGDQ